MILAILVASTLAQNPFGIPGTTTANMSSYPPANYTQHLFTDLTKQCVQWSFGGTGWQCLLGANQTAASTNGVRSLASAPASPSGGDTYYDTTKGCLQTWGGSSWTPSSCPSAAPTAPNTLLNPASSPPTTSIVGASFYDTALGCLRSWNGTSFTACAPTTQPTPPNTLLNPAASAPTTSIVGASYYDTVLGCVRTWNGSSFTVCPPTSQPSAPNTLLAPAATAPTTSIIGAAYYDTTLGCIRSWTGSAWTPAVCPPSFDLERIPQYATAPSLPTTPPATVAANKGARFFDTTQSCTRETIDGLAWGDCLTTEKSATFTVTTVTLPILGTQNYTVTITGARVGQGSCGVDGPGTGFTVVGIVPLCRITANDTVTVQFQGTLASLGLQLAGGTYRAYAQVRR